MNFEVVEILDSVLNSKVRAKTKQETYALVTFGIPQL